MPRAVTAALPPPIATIASAPRSRATSTAASTVGSGERATAAAKVPACRSPSTATVRSTRSVLPAMERPQMISTHSAAARSTSGRS